MSNTLTQEWRAKLTDGKATYSFEEGKADMKGILGGKGANLAEMTRLGFPVPPGFTITTEVCNVYQATRKMPDGLAEDGDSLAIATQLARITFPYLIFMSLATLVAAVLNSLSRFAAAAAAPILLNICLITALLYGLSLGGGVEARREAAFWMAVALSVSGFLQLVWLGFFMHRAGFRLRLRFPRVTKGVKELGILVVPAIFGAGVYQISRFVDLFFLSTLEVGSYTYLAMADRWNQLPLGIIGIALGTAILPALSRFLAREEADEAQRLQSNAIELAMLLTVPAAAEKVTFGASLPLTGGFAIRSTTASCW